MRRDSDRIAELKREIDTNPHSRQFYQLGELLRREGRAEEAAAVLRRGLQYWPKYVAAWVSLGRAELERPAPGEAISALRRALDLDPENPVAWRLLAEAEEMAGNVEEAAAAMGRAAGLVPGDETLQEAAQRLKALAAGATAPTPPAPAPREAEAETPVAAAPELPAAVAMELGVNEAAVVPAHVTPLPEPFAAMPSAAPWPPPASAEAEPFAVAKAQEPHTVEAEIGLPAVAQAPAVEELPPLELEEVPTPPAAAAPQAPAVITGEGMALLAEEMRLGPAPAAVQPPEFLPVPTMDMTPPPPLPFEDVLPPPAALPSEDVFAVAAPETAAAVEDVFGEACEEAPPPPESTTLVAGPLPAGEEDISPLATQARVILPLPLPAPTHAPPGEPPPLVEEAVGEPPLLAVEEAPLIAEKMPLGAVEELAPPPQEVPPSPVPTEPETPLPPPAAPEAAPGLPAEVAARSVEAARALIRSERLSDAAALLERLLEREPDHGEARDLLELVRDMLGPMPMEMPPLSLRERKIAALQRWLLSLTLAHERAEP